MKYQVRIAEKNYEVEIEDIHARPVIARVDGQAFEVSPGNGIKPTPQKQTSEIKSIDLPKSPVNAGANVNGSELTAPLPGTVTEIFVKAGEQIEAGQVVLIIEAMKMKNSIRSTRAGKVAEVLAIPGQTVAHKQVLVKFG